MKHFLLLLTSSFLILFACKKKDNSVDFHHEYYPMTKGSFVEYKVTMINHDNTALIKHDTTVFFLKTVIGDTVIDNEGRIARKFNRFVFDNLLQKYKFKDLWTTIIDQERVELVEENQRVIKLVFAPSEEKEWDKNAFNMDGKTNLYYEKIHQPYFINNLNFDSTVVVEEDSLLDFITYRRIYEVYATGIGLIKKHYQNFSINNSDETKPISGKELFYVITNYGVE